MPTNNDIAYIALHASNLKERLSLLAHLQQSNSLLNTSLTDVPQSDVWAIDKFLAKLAVMQIQQQLFYSELSYIPTEQDLRSQLLQFKAIERRLIVLSETDCDYVLSQHTTWLPVYQQALATLNTSQEHNLHQSTWQEPAIYYGRFAKVCEPFLRFIGLELTAKLAAINNSPTKLTIDSAIIENVQMRLLDKFEMRLARAIEADLKIYRYLNNIAVTDNSADYCQYLDQTFADAQDYHRFYSQFPVLARWIATTTNFLIANTIQFLERFVNDLAEIETLLIAEKNIRTIKALRLGLSDTHNNGKTVISISLLVTDTNGQNEQPINLIYKPRCVQAEYAMQTLLAQLAKTASVPFKTYRVLPKTGYGFAEFVEAGNNDTDDRSQVETFYQQIGGYLALFYVLGGTDLHYENIIASNVNGFICDSETMLDVIPVGMQQWADLYDSVFKTGLLDWPQQEDAGPKFSLTGCKGGGEYQVDFAVPQIVDRMLLSLRVEHQHGVVFNPGSKNRVFYNNDKVQPDAFKSNIVDGFNAVYTWFEQNKTQSIELLTEFVASAAIRFVNRATQVYAHALTAAEHAKCLHDPLEVDLVFFSLVRYPRPWDENGILAQREFASLWNLDVPIFSTIANNQHLTHNYRTEPCHPLNLSPLDNAQHRINDLNTDNRIRQNLYILTSLSRTEENNQYFSSLCIDYANRIGTDLCNQICIDTTQAPWQFTDYSLSTRKLNAIDGSLYSGAAGISLFLAYLHSIQPNPTYLAAAKRALHHARTHSDISHIGAFNGLTGLIYVLTHLAVLWKQPQFLDEAIEIAVSIRPLIPQDADFDIIHGAAGAIPVLLALNKYRPGLPQELAIECGQHLINSAKIGNDGIMSWPCSEVLGKGDLTGFSHGAAGIGWALIMLGKTVHEPRFIQAGLQAFAYENTQYDSKAHNWYDLRTSVATRTAAKHQFSEFWCSGSCGIGLSRLAAWHLLDKENPNLFNDAQIALDTTLRSLNNLENDALCHGRCGNSELLLRFGLLADYHHLQMEANVQAMDLWRKYERNRGWLCVVSYADVAPGLMVGVSGIGMHFLRLAYPERISSPLLLDPPNE